MKIAESFTERTELKNGVMIPKFGFGTYMYGYTHEQNVNANRFAAQNGYRLFDTASFYMNEQGLGEALRTSGIPREELFVSSKVWNEDHGYEGTMAAIKESLDDNQLGYFDLYLIHWPIAIGHDDDWQEMVQGSWRAMEDMYFDGKIRALGVSNFLPHHLKVLEDGRVPVMVNEIEHNIGYTQDEAHAYCNENGIVTIAYSPLRGVGTPSQLLSDLAEKYGKNVAQIILRWQVQSGTIPIPRSATESHILSNRDVFDFALTEEEMAAINALPDEGGRPHQHPDEVRIPMKRSFKTKI